MIKRLPSCKTAEGRDSDWLLVKIIEDFRSTDIYHFQNQAPGWWRDPLMGPAFPTGHKPAPKVSRYFMK